MKKTWFAVPALLALAACDSTIVDEFCTMVAAPAVRVTAVDSVTSVNVTAGSTLVLSSAEGTDSIPVPSQGTLVGWWAWATVAAAPSPSASAEPAITPGRRRGSRWSTTSAVW